MEINKRYSGNMRGFCLSGQHRKGNQFYAVRQQLCSLVLLWICGNIQHNVLGVFLICPVSCNTRRTRIAWRLGNRSNLVRVLAIARRIHRCKFIYDTFWPRNFTSRKIIAGIYCNKLHTFALAFVVICFFIFYSKKSQPKWPTETGKSVFVNAAISIWKKPTG